MALSLTVQDTNEEETRSLLFFMLFVFYPLVEGIDATSMEYYPRSGSIHRQCAPFSLPLPHLQCPPSSSCLLSLFCVYFLCSLSLSVIQPGNLVGLLHCCIVANITHIHVCIFSFFTHIATPCHAVPRLPIPTQIIPFIVVFLVPISINFLRPLLLLH
ncbi:MAG: hypothetical protein J3R72DRAFT_227318 [Linnemannia gamsii]|nr:MAG: hypothetical protein J3R72DRAFT_227318 [Linnemannia gamsii]